MTVSYVTFTQTTAETLDGNDQLFVSGRINGSSLANAIDATGSNNDIFIEGSVTNGSGRGVRIQSSSSNLNISDEGKIIQASSAGGSAVYLTGSGGFHRVMNRGEISGNFGVVMDSSSNGNDIVNFGSINATQGSSDIGGVSFRSDFNVLTNHGLVTGSSHGVYFSSFGINNTVINHGTIVGAEGIQTSGSGHSITNYGTITGSDGIAIQDGSTDLALANHGKIFGDVNHFATNADNVISNSGTIFGNVELRTGDDVYTGIGDGVVRGWVRGGDGNDRLIGGSKVDQFSGADGNDTLRGKDRDDVLAGGKGNDAIFGGRGDDDIKGGDGADNIRGGRDDDLIDGGKGADIINGGRGDDIMRGNGGSDVFVFNRNAGEDEITDFQNGKDKLDLSAFNIRTFAQLDNAGAIVRDGAGTQIDLTKIGGDGVITTEDMGISQWGASDFIF